MPVKRAEAQFLGLQAVPHCMVHRGGGGQMLGKNEY
jgi:hypothetical protein